jgi:hypothetical protein
MLAQYNNGNANIKLYEDGTRVIEYDDDLVLDMALNIDIRVSTKCAFGAKSDGTPGFCSFCHESAKQDGSECDYLKLRDKLHDLPKGIELAIGANNLTDNLFEFLWWAKCEGYICNLTINQGHLKRDLQLLNKSIEFDMIKGLGISYRGGLKWDVPQELLDYDNTVFHVIAGIDTYAEVEALAAKGVKKILILGYKTFGYGVNYFNSNTDDVTKNIKQWIWWVHKLFNKFDVVSFDNLALEQLKINRFFTDENWSIFNNGEHSFYINAVDGYYAPSSRSNEKTDWNKKNIFEYFKNLEKNGVK